MTHTHTSVGRSSFPLSGGEDGTMHRSTNPLTMGTHMDVLEVLFTMRTVVPHAVILIPP
jgi:hypothetical protein